MGILTRLFRLIDQFLRTNLAERLKRWRTKRKIAKEWTRTSRAFPISAQAEAEIKKVISDIEFYWTPADKQVVLANLIIENNLKKAVEIGVHKGGSFVPQAVALKHTGGTAIGIDPYSDAEAEQEDNREILDAIDSNVIHPDRDDMYESVVALLERHGLSSICRILRMTSNDAASEIEDGIDLLHIDGNHDFDRVMDDLVNYLPKLRVGGFLVMDDINWGSIAPLYGLVKKQMRPVYEARGWGCCQKTHDSVELYDPR